MIKAVAAAFALIMVALLAANRWAPDRRNGGEANSAVIHVSDPSLDAAELAALRESCGLGDPRSSHRHAIVCDRSEVQNPQVRAILDRPRDWGRSVEPQNGTRSINRSVVVSIIENNTGVSGSEVEKVIDELDSIRAQNLRRAGRVSGETIVDLAVAREAAPPRPETSAEAETNRLQTR